MERPKERPDAARFARFTAHLARIDGDLQRFAAAHGLRLEHNVHRAPSRVLRWNGNPRRVIDLYMEDNWRIVEWREDLPHAVAVAAFCTPPAGKRLYRKATVVEGLPFREIEERLLPLLEQAWALVESWPAPVLTEDDPDAAGQGWARTVV